MTVNQVELEAVWDEAWIEAPDGALTFFEKLTEKWQSARALNAGGSLSNISKNSSSHGYAQPHPDHITTKQKEDACFAARKLYRQIAAALASTDEAVIYAEGLARFNASTGAEYRHDFSCLRA